MKTNLILAFVAAALGYISGLGYMGRRGPVMIPEGASSNEAALIQHEYAQKTQVVALIMAGYGIMIVAFVLTLGTGIKILLVNLWKAPAAFREGYRDGKR